MRFSVQVFLILWLFPSLLALGNYPPVELRLRETVTPARLVQLRTELEQHLDALDRRLAIGGEENATAWKNYLLLGPLRSALQETPLDRVVANDSLRRFFGPYPGLEVPELQRVRQALEEVIGLAEILESDLAPQDFLAAKEADLRRWIAQSNTPSASGGIFELGKSLHWFDRYSQESAWVEPLAKPYLAANLSLRVSGALLLGGVRETIHDKRKISYALDGRSIDPEVTTNATITARLRNNPKQAEVWIDVQGHNRGQGQFKQGAVTATIGGNLTFQGGLSAYLTYPGFVSGQAHIQAHPSIQGNASAPGRPLIQKIARRRLAGEMPDIRREITQTIEKQVEQEINTMAKPALDKLNRLYQENLLQPFDRLNLRPRRFLAHSTAEAITIDAVLADPSQLGTDQPPPEFQPEMDASGAIHESALLNLFDRIASGQKFSARLVKKMVKAIGSPYKPRSKAVDPTFHLRLANRKPVDVRFADGQIELCFHFTSLMDLPLEFSVSVKFLIEEDETGYYLALSDALEVDSRGPGLTPEQDQLVRSQFVALLPRELFFDRLLTSGGVSIAVLEELKIKSLSAKNSWLVFEYKREPSQGVAE